MTSPNGNTSSGGAETTSRIVVGLFQNRSRAEDAIRELKEAGFRNEQIGMAAPDRNEREDDAREDARNQAGEDKDEVGNNVEDTAKGMAQGAAVGALGGGVVGGLVGLIGSLLIPGAGPIVLGGVLASALMGVGLGVATGGLIGALMGMGVPERDAQYFEQGLRKGGTLVTVNAGEGTPEALSILQRYGADFGPSWAQPFDRSSGYEGQDRRCRHDERYAGPERRLVGV